MNARSGLKIGLIGCGRWGKHILHDLLELGAEVSVAIHQDESIERVKALGAHFVTTKLKELAGMDGLVVATPTATHFEVISQLIEFFPHTPIFSEKPLTPSLTQAQQLAERAGDHLFVMHKWRYHPGILALAELAKKEKLGK